MNGFDSHFKTEEDIPAPLKYWLVFSFTFYAVFVPLFFIMNTTLGAEGSDFFDLLLLAVSVALAVVYLLVYYIFYKICGYYEKQNEMNMLIYQSEAIEKYVLQHEDSDRVIRTMSHDLKHNLLVWKELVRNRNYAEALKNIEEYELNFEENKRIDIGNNIANAIINQKMLAARKSKIKFIVRGGFHADLIISQSDLCSLMGNMIDNALEASLQTPATQERKIEMNINRDGKFLFINLKNNYEREPELKNGTFVSLKENRGSHGIGIISIKQIAEKYNGSIDIAYKNKLFTLDIMLRAYEDEFDA